MSLINDALRRAKAAQPPPAPPATPGHHFQPVEPASPVRQGAGVLLQLGLGLAALLLLLVVWLWFNEHRPEITARAKIAASETRPDWPERPRQQPARTAAPDAPVPVAVPAPAPEPQTAAAMAAPSQGTAEPAVTNSIASAPPTNTVPVVVPAPLRLKGIIYNQARSSVVINGKSLFIGDRIGDFRVAAIGPETATLVGAGKTNILSLDE